MCLYISNSQYPLLFLLIWILFLIFDLSIAIVSSLTDIRVCQSPVMMFNLQFCLKTLGCIGLIVSAFHITFEMNSDYVSNRNAMIMRGIMAFIYFIWLIITIIYLWTVSPDCHTSWIYIFTIISTIFNIMQAIILNFSTRYGFPLFGSKPSLLSLIHV